MSQNYESSASAPPRLVDHVCVVVEGLSEGAAWGEAVEVAFGVPGVRRVFVSHTLETMYLSYDPAVTTATAVRAALAKGGLRLVAERRRG